MDCLRGTQVVKRKPKENQRRTYIGAWVIFNALSDTDGIFFINTSSNIFCTSVYSGEKTISNFENKAIMKNIFT
jgi:hypothetical protein